jgi:hypothetical protein
MASFCEQGTEQSDSTALHDQVNNQLLQEGVK